MNDINEIFEENIINSLDKDNIIKIITYLKTNNITFINDIINSYIDLLLIPYDIFIDKFKKLVGKYGIDNISNDLNLLEEML